MELPHYQPFYLAGLADLETEIDRLGLNIPLTDDLSILGTPERRCPSPASIPNRFCANPISGLDAQPDGSPGPLTWLRYRRYAEGGFGMIWLESTVPGPAAPAGKLRLHDDTVEDFAQFTTGIRDAARKCHDHEITLILQLATPLPPDQDLPDDEEIDDHIRLLAEGAAHAAAAGFDGVDIQACHGALPGRLLSAFDRDGAYGGASLEDRSRALHSALIQSRDLAPELLLATRLCAYDALCPPLGFGTDPDDHREPDLTEPLQLVESLHDTGLGLLNITIAGPRLGGSAEPPISDHGVPAEHPLMTQTRQLQVARLLRAAAPDLPLVGSGFSWLRQFLPEVAAAAISDGWIDLVGMGRGALAYPNAPAELLQTGRMNPASTCMVCFACDEMWQHSGPVGCPVRDPGNYGPLCRQSEHCSPDGLQSAAQRCHLCEHPPCVAASRTGVDIPAYISAFRQGDESAAYEIIRSHDLLPEMTSRLSPGWLHSEGSCIEAALHGKPVPILDLQFAIAWRARDEGTTGVRMPKQPSNKNVAIVGAGPAGLAAAARLLEYGHEIDLYERSDRLGGTPERIIPATRLPPTLPEIGMLLGPAFDAGRLRIHHHMSLGENLELDTLDAESDAVLLATGLWQERKLAGDDQVEGVIDALSFLEAAKQDEITSVPARVAILAGGDCAMDAARTAGSLGADDIFIVFDGPRSDMHWHMDEDWFSQPGHHALMHCRPLGFHVDYHARLQGLRIRHSELGKDGELNAGLVIEAMGLEIDNKLRRALNDIDINEYGLVAVTNTSHTSRPGIHATGALVNGGASVARCVAEGMAAADAIHQELSEST